MPTGWYRIPYVPVSSPILSCELEITVMFGSVIRKASDQILYADCQIDGVQALVKVQAPATVQTQLAARYPAVTDPASVWTATYRTIRNEAGIITQGTRTLPTTPWRDIDRLVLDDGAWDALKAKRDSLIQLADRDGSYRFTPLDRFEKILLLRMFGEAGYGLDRLSTGTFPTTGVLDTCVRADEGPPPSANWTEPINPGRLGNRIVSNTMQRSTGTTADHESYWNLTTYGGNSESYFTLQATSGNYLGAAQRIQNPGTADADQYIWFIVSPGLRWYKQINGSFTALGTGVAYTQATGDGVGGESIGTSLTGYKRVSGSWSSVEGITDSSITGAGYIGVVFQSGSAQSLTNFSGGTVNPGTGRLLFRGA